MIIQSNPVQALNDLDETTNILLAALVDLDEDKAHEAITIMLMQGMDYLGLDHPVMQQFFPVWDVIMKHIEASNMQDALSQTEIWQSQLHEIMGMVKSN